jgi:hypothetical protein
VNWYQGQAFDVALTRADWCHSVMRYFPKDMVEGGAIFRLALDPRGLDLCGWERYQQRANIPAAARRQLGEASVRLGDNLGDWYFHFGDLALDGRLLDVEQYHRGRWTTAAEICERAPLAQLHGRRLLFEAVFKETGHAPGLSGGTSLFVCVGLDHRLVADHIWVRQSWPHLRPGQQVRFIATVVRYRRRDGSVGWTLDEVNGLETLDE